MVVSFLLALFLAGLGLLISTFSRSNRVSLTLSLLVLVALYGPTQLTTVGLRPSAGDRLQRLDPFTSALRYLDKLVVGGHPATQDVGLLVTPLVAAVLFPALVLALADRLTLAGREQP